MDLRVDEDLAQIETGEARSEADGVQELGGETWEVAKCVQRVAREEGNELGWAGPSG